MRRLVGATSAGRARGTALAIAACVASSAFAQDFLAPTPKIVIYPGELIVEEALTDAPLSGTLQNGPIALSHDQLIGKMSRRTLLPGRPIPLAAIDNPRVVRNGGEVTLIYIDGALTITTSGAAMQDGGAGDLIRVRNADTGVTVTGRLRPDGSVLVSGG